MRFEAAATINASPETIWDAVADPETWPSWTRVIYKVKKLTEGPLGVGSRVRITIWFILPVSLHMTITEYIPGRRVVMEGKTLLARMTRYYMLKPLDGATRAIAGGRASGIMAWLVWLSGEAMSEDIVYSLKKKIEG